MSDYKKQLQRIVKDYRQSGQEWPASSADIARWALKNKKYDLRTPTIEKIVRRELAQAMREESLRSAVRAGSKKNRPSKPKHWSLYDYLGNYILDTHKPPKTR